jgi:hypothetical protein
VVTASISSPFVSVWLQGQEKVKQYSNQARLDFGSQIRQKSPEKGNSKFVLVRLAFGCFYNVVHPSKELNTR